MDAVAVDGTTITKVGGKLTVVGGTGGGEADAVKWENILNKPSWLTATNPSYTKTESDNKYLLKSAYTAADILSKLKTVDSTGSGLDADLLDGIHASGLLTAVSSTAGTNLSVTVGGTTKSVSGLYAKYFAPTMILNNTDLDSLTIPGMYYCTANSIAATLKNCPTALAFSLLVEQHASGGFKQTLTEYIPGNMQMWVRNSYQGEFGEWREIAFTNSNVASATKLQTARSINGTSFDGTANIVTSYWGTARTLSLTGNATGSVSINGSSNVSMNVNVNYAASAAKLDLQDTRSVETPPIGVDKSKGLFYHFKMNTADGLNDGGRFHSVLQFVQWGDESGGFSKQLALTDNGNMWLRNASSETAWGTWKKLAFTSDNVASATKLATQRTLWGRPFDGTQNVTGSLSGVISLVMTDALALDIGDKTGNFAGGYIVRDKNDNYQYMAGMYSTAGMVNYLFYGGSSTSPVMVFRNTNVGIGTTSPARKLDVSGSTGTTDLYINGIRLYKGTDGLLYLDGSLAVTGGITAFAQGSLSAATIMDAVAVDGTTITKTGGVLTAKQFSGGTIGQSLTINTGATSGLQLIGSNTAWQAAYIQLRNDALTGQGKLWQMEVGGSSDGNGNLQFQCSDGSTGSVNTSPWYRVSFFKHGNSTAIGAAGSVTNTSDIRLKTVKRYLTQVLDKIEGIAPFYYTWKDQPLAGTLIGFSAQNVQLQFPELVSVLSRQDGMDILGLDYATFGAVVSVAGLKELYALFKQQQQTINELQDTINQLRRAA